MQLPVQYSIKNESTDLDCMFLVPLVPPEDGGPGATFIARLAALQLFHEWLHKSWDRVLCWYHHLCRLEAENNITSAEAPDGTIEEKLRKILQEDRKNQSLKSEAMLVDLPVVIAVAEAVLGEAEVLAAIVSSEELPHHFNAPCRLPEKCEEDKYVSSRIHRHGSLASRRKQLQCLTGSQTHSISMLKHSIKSHLIFATVRRALQMDALGCKPIGLDVVSFKAVAASSTKYGDVPEKCSMMVYTSPPKRLLLPLIDELLSSYDSYRQALWPIEDPVVKYLSQGDAAWVGAAVDPQRRAATARIALRKFLFAIQATTTDTALGHLRPHMMTHWTIRMYSSKGQKRTGSHSSTEEAHTYEGQPSPTPTHTPTTEKQTHSPQEDRPEPHSLQDKVDSLAECMPLLARTQVPCSEAVFATSRRDPRLAIPPTHTGSQYTVAEHLEVLAPDLAEHQTAGSCIHYKESQASTHSSSEVIRQIWGMTVSPSLSSSSAKRRSPAEVIAESSPSDPIQGIRSLSNMPERRASKDFISLKVIADQLSRQQLQSPVRQAANCATMGGYSAPALSIVHKAVWDRVLALPHGAPARVWQSILTPPAPLFAQALTAQDKWEVARIFRRLSRAQQSLQQLSVPWQTHQADTADAGDSVLAQSQLSSSDTAQQQGRSDGATPQLPPQVPGSYSSVWRELLRSSTDADGQRIIRGAWAASAGLAKLAKVKSASRNGASQPDWQNKSSAILDLQAAVQDLTRESSRQSVESVQWGDHKAHRSTLYKSRARFSEIKGLAAPLEGSLGPMATPQWLKSAAASKGDPVDTNALRQHHTYKLPSLQKADAVVSDRVVSQTPEWLQARMAHAWTCLGVASALSSSEQESSDGARSAFSAGITAAWTALLHSHSAVKQSDAAAQDELNAENAGPGPLRYYEFEEEVLFAWDLLVTARKITRRFTDPIDGMGGAVWQVLLDEAALRAHAVQRAWGLHMHASDAYTPQPAQHYRYEVASRHRGMLRRSTDMLEVWTKLQLGTVQGPLGGPVGGAVGGSRFSAVRDSMDQLTKASMDQNAGQGLSVKGSSSRSVYSFQSDTAARRSWQLHSNRLSATAARKLRARAEVFRDEWEHLDQDWTQSEGAQVVQKSSKPGSVSVLQDTVGVFDYLPEDLDACLKQISKARAIYNDVRAKSLSSTSRGGSNSESSKPPRRGVHSSDQSLEFGSMPSDSRSPHDQLRMFAELLLMQSRPQYRSGMSSNAWFPADQFVVQFQQRKSGEFVFRKQTGENPKEYPSLQVSNVYPTVACVGVVLTGLTPGLTMTNKPGALKHDSPSPVARLGRLLSRVAVLGAVPATIAVATMHRDPQNASSPDSARNTKLGQASEHSSVGDMQLAAPENTDSSRLSSSTLAPAPESDSASLAAPASAAATCRATVSVRQQVAMAKELMQELSGCVWHGMEASKRGNAVRPAVFHVLMSPEGSVLDIVPHSTPARRLLPRLPIMDSIVSRKSGEKLRRWRAQYFEPSSKKFDPKATVAFTPRRKHHTIPKDAVVLELVVYPDATCSRARSNVLVKLVRRIDALGRVAIDLVSAGADFLAGNSSRAHFQRPTLPTESVPPPIASTVLAAPVDMDAFSLLMDSFQMATQEYEPHSILDIQEEGGQERCMACVQRLAGMLRTHRDSQGVRDVCKSVLARLEAQLQEYDDLCTLRDHDESAPVSREQALLETCRACTKRYHMVVQEALDFHDTSVARERIASRKPVEVEKVASGT